ncbi:hypothetical protein BJX76DRAFT_361405 [Aspergillus varians]
MPEQQYDNPRRHLPLEIIFTIARSAAHELPVKDALALRQLNKNFCKEVETTLCGAIDGRPSIWKSLPHLLKCRYLDRKLRETQEDCFLTIFMGEMLRLNETEATETMRTKLIEAIALGHYNIEDLTTDERIMTDNDWRLYWASEPILDDLHILLACSAVLRGDVGELRRILPNCKRLLSVRFGLSILEVAAQIGSAEVVTALIPVTGVEELHDRGFRNTPLGHALWYTDVYSPFPANVRPGQSLVVIALKYNNADALDVWLDFLKRVSRQSVRVAVSKTIQAAEAAKGTELHQWFTSTLDSFMNTKTLNYFTFARAIRFRDIKTIDAMLSEDDFDPAFIPGDERDERDKRCNILPRAMELHNKWYGFSLIRTLLRRGVSPIQSNPSDPWPLSIAVQTRNMELVSLILDYSDDGQSNPSLFSSSSAPTPWTLLHAAVSVGDSEVVELILSRDIDPIILQGRQKFRVQLAQGQQISLFDIVRELVPEHPRRPQWIQKLDNDGLLPNSLQPRLGDLATLTGVIGLRDHQDLRRVPVTYRLVRV